MNSVVLTITPDLERGWGGHFHTFAVLLFVGMQERSVDPVTGEHRFSVFACRRYGIVRRVLMPVTCQKGQKLNSITLSFCIIQVTA